MIESYPISRCKDKVWQFIKFVEDSYENAILEAGRLQRINPDWQYRIWEEDTVSDELKRKGRTIMAGKKGGSGGMFKSMGKGQAGNTGRGAKKGGKK